MGIQLQWNFNKPTYQPGETGSVSVWFHNDDPWDAFVPACAFAFNFGRYDFPCQVRILAQHTGFLGHFRFQLPPHVAGTVTFRVRARLWYFQQNLWQDQGEVETTSPFLLNIFPLPRYNVFVSRSFDIADQAVCEPFIEALNRWGLGSLHPYNLPRISDELLLDALKSDIRAADAVVAIATPRYPDALTGLWRTMEWLHGETGIAFGMNKPLLILQHSNVQLTGLPGYLSQYGNIPSVLFDNNNIPEAVQRLERLLPGFREWIVQHQRREFDEARRQLGNSLPIGLAGLAIGAGVAVIALTLSSSQRVISDNLESEDNGKPWQPKQENGPS